MVSGTKVFINYAAADSKAISLEDFDLKIDITKQSILGYFERLAPTQETVLWTLQSLFQGLVSSAIYDMNSVAKHSPRQLIFLEFINIYELLLSSGVPIRNAQANFERLSEKAKADLTELFTKGVISKENYEKDILVIENMLGIYYKMIANNPKVEA